MQKMDNQSKNLTQTINYMLYLYFFNTSKLLFKNTQ